MSICSKYFDIWHSHLESFGALYAALGTSAIYLNNREEAQYKRGCSRASAFQMPFLSKTKISRLSESRNTICESNTD